MVGLPFFVLSTVSPTMQRWFSATDHPRADDPYFLYAAGNIGSLLALLGYPLIIESRFSLADQSRVWTLGYALFVVLALACAIVVRHQSRPAAQPRPSLPPRRLPRPSRSPSSRGRPGCGGSGSPRCPRRSCWA